MIRPNKSPGAAGLRPLLENTWTNMKPKPLISGGVKGLLQVSGGSPAVKEEPPRRAGAFLLWRFSCSM